VECLPESLSSEINLGSFSKNLLAFQLNPQTDNMEDKPAAFLIMFVLQLRVMFMLDDA
jgi:hypothetical protein